MLDKLDFAGLRGPWERTCEIKSAPMEVERAGRLVGHHTYRRNGQITYQAFVNTGVYPVDTQGEYPFQQFDFYGREPDQNTEGAKGYASCVKIIQMVEQIIVATDSNDLPNGDGRPRRLPAGFQYTMAAEACTLRPGNVLGTLPTEASASIDVFARDSFEYSGAGDSEFYVLLINPFPAVQDDPSYEQLGMGAYTLRMYNMTTQKDITRFKVPLDQPQGITAIDVEYVLSTRHAAKVSKTDQVGVELHHSAYAVSKGRRGVVGAISGFTIVRTTLA